MLGFTTIYLTLVSASKAAFKILSKTAQKKSTVTIFGDPLFDYHLGHRFQDVGRQTFSTSVEGSSSL
jgi:hypothetical protein